MIFSETCPIGSRKNYSFTYKSSKEQVFCKIFLNLGNWELKHIFPKSIIINFYYKSLFEDFNSLRPIVEIITIKPWTYSNVNTALEESIPFSKVLEKLGFITCSLKDRTGWKV